MIALILVVLPTAILSILAARTVSHSTLIMQAQLYEDASRALTIVDHAIRDKALQSLEIIRVTLAGRLGPTAATDQFTSVAQRLAAANPTVSDVFVFMNPWGFLASSLHTPAASDSVFALDLLANTLRRRIADSEAQRPPNRSPRRRSSEAAQPQGPPSPADISFFENATAYYFAPMPGTASAWTGYTADRDALNALITQCISEHAVAGMVLSFTTDALRPPNDMPDIVVSDSLSPESHTRTEAVERGEPGLPILASTFLAPPLDGIELLAQAAPGIEIQQMAAARKRLYGWGLGVVVAWVLLGIGIVLRHALAEIRQARQRGEFLLGVSHDLRTPLASMRMLAESLAHGHVRRKEQPRFLNTIVAECDRLSRLIERVLYLVRYGQGALVYCQRDIDVGELVTQTVADLKTYAGSLQVKVPPDIAHVQGDRAALQQVMLNLLDNAIKYGRRDEEGDAPGAATYPPSPSDFQPPVSAEPVRVEVALTTRTRRRYPWGPMYNWICISVRDYGMGIAPHEQRHIFRRFYRSHRAHDRNVSGVGLGLALCRHVIRSHGGWIEVESKVGEGAMFSVYLKSA